jgi:hypothetical protein
MDGQVGLNLLGWNDDPKGFEAWCEGRRSACSSCHGSAEAFAPDQAFLKESWSHPP